MDRERIVKLRDSIRERVRINALSGKASTYEVNMALSAVLAEVDALLEVCVECDGSGAVLVNPFDDNELTDVCPRCGGSGKETKT
jgi:DnaJ-class molecular chaperone